MTRFYGKYKRYVLTPNNDKQGAHPDPGDPLTVGGDWGGFLCHL